MASIRSVEIASVLDMKASASVSLMSLICPSCVLRSWPSMDMPRRSNCSNLGRSAMTLERSARLGLALAAHTKSAAARLKRCVSSCCGPLRMAAMASTSAHTLNRNSRISSRTGMSLSMLRISMVYWMARVSFCSTCWAMLTTRAVLPCSDKNLARNF